MGRIQMRETNYLQIVTSGLHRTAGPYKVHDPAPRAAIADLANIPAQPCRSHRDDRSLRGSNADLRASVCLSGSRPRTATAALVRGDTAPDLRVASAADLGGVPVERGADL